MEEDKLVVSGVLRFKNRIQEEVRDAQLGSAASGEKISEQEWSRVSFPVQSRNSYLWTEIDQWTSTYDHRLRKTGHPVRSAIHKPQIGRLVVGWVTTSESLLLYVLF